MIYIKNIIHCRYFPTTTSCLSFIYLLQLYVLRQLFLTENHQLFTRDYKLRFLSSNFGLTMMNIFLSAIFFKLLTIRVVIKMNMNENFFEWIYISF